MAGVLAGEHRTDDLARLVAVHAAVIARLEQETAAIGREIGRLQRNRAKVGAYLAPPPAGPGESHDLLRG